MFAAHQKLGRLVAIIDNNELQIDGCIHEVCDPGDLGARFAAFGWSVTTADGHDLAALIDALSVAKADSSPQPKLVVARTVKGKGVPFMENQAGWHGKAPDAAQLQEALAALGAAQ